ncbi:D-amino acid dehydrogenase [Sinomonas sp. JGH33]|uniref:D-amino acid dehydrogenase n=1 Tax=Sinomonas terricola TaxID=3110330 RepID=A0ABU5TAX2_9MICC|nr:D-amino acid dehydrogenase [Sinomonas sp. JGH33]MEA5456842.1 D-amino acid dehydrogenase [Sinomonas sp. JGH33]
MTRVIVVGAGIVGLSTAYELRSRGNDVLVIDREGREAAETSAATAGLIAPGHSYAWASPSAPWELVRSLFSSDTSIRVRPRLDLELVAWGFRFLRECSAARATSNTLAKLELAQRSQTLFEKALRNNGFAFEPSSGGVLYLYRDPAALARAVERGTLMRDHGRAQRQLGPTELFELEPALSRSLPTFAGAIHDPSDSSGDPEQFAAELRARAEAMGVEFRFGEPVTGFEVDGGRGVRAVRTERSVFPGDAFVVAGGPSSRELLKRAGLRLPVYPARGYSVTAPITNDDDIPHRGGIDEKTLVAWSRFGNKLRLSATAEFAGYSTAHAPKDFDNILSAGNELFPGALDFGRATFRVGLRPMTPDGPPLIGPTKVPQLFLNTGHGHLGWTMAFGSAELLADYVSGNKPSIEPAPYSPARWGI